MTIVAIYTRLSADPTGAQTATARQLASCRAFAEAREWQVGPIYEDVDVSAYQRGVIRPDYEAMLSDIRSSRVDGIVAWKLDRLVRRPLEFERLWSTCESNGVFLASAMEPIDTSTDMGLALVRVLVAFASLESATIGVRLRSKNRERAELGQPHTTAACYGMKKGWLELDEDQAANIRNAAADVLAGSSLHAIAARWNATGVKPLRAKFWTIQALRELLTAHRLTGERVHCGEVVGRGTWPTVLDAETGARLRKVLLDPRRRTSFPAPDRALLSGLLRCGRCGATLMAGTESRSKERMFACPAPPTGCSGLSVRREPATEHVVGAMLDRFNRNRLRDVDERHAREVPVAVLRARSRGLRQAAWDECSLEQQRSMIQALVSCVHVRPQGRGGCRFDAGRLLIEWRRPGRRWTSVAETSDRLGVSRDDVYKMIRSGELPAEKVGGAWLVHLGSTPTRAA